MEKKRKFKKFFGIDSRVDDVMFSEMCLWEDKFLSRKGRKNSLIGYG